MTKAPLQQANAACAVQLIARRTGAAHRVGGAIFEIVHPHPRSGCGRFAGRARPSRVGGPRIAPKQ
jgi:hypothetical protein